MAWVNGCHLVSTLCADSLEGFLTTVSRSVEITATVDGRPITTSSQIIRGPFKTIVEAQQYAHAWIDASSPPPIPEVLTSTLNAAVDAFPESRSQAIEN